MKAQLVSNTHRDRIKLETLLELETHCNSLLYEDHLGEGSIISICAEKLYDRFLNMYRILHKTDYLIKCQLLKQVAKPAFARQDLHQYFTTLFRENRKTTYEDAVRLVRGSDTISPRLRQPAFKDVFEEVAEEWRARG